MGAHAGPLRTSPPAVSCQELRAAPSENLFSASRATSPGNAWRIMVAPSHLALQQEGVHVAHSQGLTGTCYGRPAPSLMLCVMLQSMRGLAFASLPLLPHAVCGLHFLVHLSLCNTYTRTPSQALLLGMPPRMVISNQIGDVKDSDHIVMAKPWRSTGLEVMELRWGALGSPFTAPLLQVSGCLILCKDVNHTVYKVHAPLSP